MLACASCRADNPEGSRFCNSCGARLGRVWRGRSSSASCSGEHRVVTMLFCDVRGSTAMAEELDAEAWTDVMNEAYEHLIAPVYRYEGTVARLMGDAILAFFGAPRAHEDDPQRAVMAGLEIVSSVGPLRERLAREHGLDLNVRVGINTGPVVVGEVGSELRREYTAMGDAVNVAARMEQTAEPGTVQITEDTYRLVADLFDAESLGPVELKGKREPVPAYRVRGPPRRRPGRSVGPGRSRRRSWAVPRRWRCCEPRSTTCGAAAGPSCSSRASRASGRAGSSRRRTRCGPSGTRTTTGAGTPGSASRTTRCSPTRSTGGRCWSARASSRPIRADVVREDRSVHAARRPGVGGAERASLAGAPRRRARGRAAIGGRGVPARGERGARRIDDRAGWATAHRLRGHALVRPRVARARARARSGSCWTTRSSCCSRSVPIEMPRRGHFQQWIRSELADRSTLLELDP